MIYLTSCWSYLQCTCTSRRGLLDCSLPRLSWESVWSRSCWFHSRPSPRTARTQWYHRQCLHCELSNYCIMWLTCRMHATRVRYLFVLFGACGREERALHRLTLAGFTLTSVGPPIPPEMSGIWPSWGSTEGAPVEPWRVCACAEVINSSCHFFFAVAHATVNSCMHAS